MVPKNKEVTSSGARPSTKSRGTCRGPARGYRTRTVQSRFQHGAGGDALVIRTAKNPNRLDETLAYEGWPRHLEHVSRSYAAITDAVLGHVKGIEASPLSSRSGTGQSLVLESSFTSFRIPLCSTNVQNLRGVRRFPNA